MSTSMRFGFVLFTAIAIGGVTGLSAQAQNAPHVSWKFPNLNPLAPKPNGERSMTAQVVDPFGVIPGTSNNKTRTASFGQPPVTKTLDKSLDGTKKAVARTADFLNPFNDGQKQPQIRQDNVTGANSMFSQQANQRSAGKTERSWLPGWGGGKTPGGASKPRTVNEFLAQPRNQP